LDPQQLQIARAALWHQTAATDSSGALRTLDDAARWLEDIGFCLFLPRHTQLPAPAPSFVEACVGKASVTPPPDALREATALGVRLVGERRAVPLNLLGNFSEQPDFLVTPEVLPWVAAIRGDRQWKSAPGGRTAPIVVRTFEALDREGELTAVQLRETVGHEISEAAALRALMELWTGLRAMPVYAEGEATRWTLLKNRFATELATVTNTAQTTALSALLSLYLRSAVAATAEEAEIFLSPLTARSRIREVLHGMMATRQLSATTVASQTLLFVEGSLPETLSTPQAEAPRPVVVRPRGPVAGRPLPRKGPRPTRWELPAREAPAQPEPGRPWQKKPAAAHGEEPGGERPRRESRPFAGTRPTSRPRSSSGPHREQPGQRGNKPRERRGTESFRGQAFRDRRFRSDHRETSQERPAGEGRPEQKPRWRSAEGKPPQFRREWKSGGKGRGDRPWRDRAGPQGERRPTADEARSGKPARPFRPGKPFGGKPARPEGPGETRSGRPERPFRQGKPFGGKPTRPFRPGKAFGGKPARPEGPGETRSGRPERPFRKGKPFAGKPARPEGSKEGRYGSASRPFRPGKVFPGKARREGRGAATTRPGNPKNKFRKPSPGGRKSSKNRSEKEAPE